jgi:hypothetical protein
LGQAQNEIFLKMALDRQIGDLPVGQKIRSQGAPANGSRECASTERASGGLRVAIRPWF